MKTHAALRGVGRRLAVTLLVVTLLAALLPGCALPFPGGRSSSVYLLNQGGQALIGVRCYPKLYRIEVGHDSRDQPFWVAVAPDGVDRFVLLNTAQPGVDVEVDDATDRLDGPWWVHVFVARASRNLQYRRGVYGVAGAVSLQGLPSGKLAAGNGETMSWEEYVKLPDRDFNAESDGGCN